MKQWKIINESITKDISKILLENRGIKTKKEIEEFLNPKLESVTSKSVGLNKEQLKKAIGRIQKAIKNQEQIVVFGDYDVDGICGTAILWETLNDLGAKVMPYIPHRVEEGYGLSIKSIQSVILNLFQDLHQNKTEMPKQVRHDNRKGLIITVDNGIVANKAVDFANKEKIDVIITDHHVPSKKLPDAFAIVHTTKLCGAGVAWMLAQSIRRVIPNSFRDLVYSGNKILKRVQHDNDKESHLELVALATVADLVPLIDANRTLVKFGLEHLRSTKRVGLLELFKEAVLNQKTIGVYEVGHIIAPRLNAMGRLEQAMDSLRLLCTNKRERAKMLAQKLGSTNRERQELTLATVEHAKDNLKSQIANVKSTSVNLKSLLFIAHETYQQGVIGLVAGKLVEEFYRPAIVVSKGETYSKASARSINGFNIIEFIRSASELLVDVGGHPMAAGFTVETSKLYLVQKTLEDKANELLNEEKLTRTLRIDCELDLSLINDNLYDEIQKLSPFGMGNPEPTFVSRAVTVEDIRVVGKEGSHLKLVVSQKTIASRHSGEEERRLQNLSASLRMERDSGRAHSSLARMTRGFDGIAFGMGEKASEFRTGDAVDVVYTIDRNEWNGSEKLQLKIKDIKDP